MVLEGTSSKSTDARLPAGVNSKAVSTYTGHASITLDRYGHPMPASDQGTRVTRLRQSAR